MRILAKSNFNEYRLKHGYSIQTLADTAGIAYRTAFRVENRHPVRPTTARKICDTFRCEFDEVFRIEQ